MKGGELVDIEKVIRVAKTQNIDEFVVAGIVTKINVFFSMNCLEKLFDNYEISKDYRKSFAQVVFYMYQETERQSLDLELSEDHVISATDEELTSILEFILEHDVHLKEAYKKLECDNIYERFYSANDNLIKDAIKPISESFKHLNKMYIPQISGIEKVLAQQNTIMKSFTMPQVDALNQIASTLAKQVEFTTAQVKIMDFSYLNNLPKFEFPQMQSILENIPKFTMDIAGILAPFTQQVAQMQENMRSQLARRNCFQFLLWGQT